MFDINIKIVNPMLYDDDLDSVLLTFLNSIGYMPRIDPQRDFKKAINTVPYRLFKECFLLKPYKEWSVDELIVYLGTTRTTLYRHLNKLKSFDLLDEKQDGMNKKYKLKYGNLEIAWEFVETNVKLAMDNYKSMVKHISELANDKKYKSAGGEKR